MANRATRLARAKKREKIRLGPSDTAQAYMNLLGIEIEVYPPVAQYINIPGHDAVGFYEDKLARQKLLGDAMIKARMNVKSWRAVVKDTPHITKNLYCTCDEQWIAEVKLLRMRADKFKKEHANHVVFPSVFQNLTASYGASQTGRWSSCKSSAQLATLLRYATDLKTEARVAAHLTIEPKE